MAHFPKAILVLLMSAFRLVKAITFVRPIAFLIMYKSDDTSDLYFRDPTTYNTSDTSLMFIPDPSPTYLIRGTEDVRTFQWSKNTREWKVRNCTLSLSADPGVEKLIWVMNESRVWPMGDGSTGMAFDASVAHVDCDPIEKADGT